MLGRLGNVGRCVLEPPPRVSLAVILGVTLKNAPYYRANGLLTLTLTLTGNIVLDIKTTEPLEYM